MVRNINFIQLTKCLLRNNVVLTDGTDAWTFKVDDTASSMRVIATHARNGKETMVLDSTDTMEAAEYVSDLLRKFYTMDNNSQWTLRKLFRAA